MFKNKQKHFLISVLLMILFLAASGTAFSADLNEDAFWSTTQNTADTIDLTSIDGLSGSVDLSNAATFDVNQIRTAFQVQKWLERNARGGVRYTEYLRSHFG